MRGLCTVKEILRLPSFLKYSNVDYVRTLQSRKSSFLIGRRLKVFPKKDYQKVKCCGYSNACENQIKEETVESNLTTSEDIFSEKIRGDVEKEKQFKLIQYEICILKEETGKVPSIIKVDTWEELMKLKTSKQRERFLNFLFLKEQMHLNKRLKANKDKSLIYTVVEQETALKYKLGENTFYLRIYKKSLTKLNDLRLISAYMFSQHIVIDCSYDDYMTLVNKRYCASQVADSMFINREHINPFYVSLCNVNKNCDTIKYINKNLHHESGESLLCDSYEKSYLDLFPKNKLVYLTPHTKNLLNNFNSDDIYIIGAFVDRGTGEKISLAKAKEQNLRMAKLPLDKYLIWRRGTKNLPINIVIKILLDYKRYNDWEKALQNVPKRFTED